MARDAHVERDLPNALLQISEPGAKPRPSRRLAIGIDLGTTNTALAYVDTAELAPGEMTCRACGGQLVRRNDDDPAVVRERFKVYHAEMQPVLEHYGEQGLLVVVDGQGTQADVFERLKAALLARRPQGV